MRQTFTLTLAALAFAAAPAFAIDFKVSGSGTTEFDMPGRNVCCSYFPNASEGPVLSCSRVEPKYWTVTLTPKGKLTVYKDPGEVPGCGYGEPLGNIFAYGSTWTKDAFTCTSSKRGVKCMANGKGFRLSRAGLVKY